jgi:serine/threonine protein phosphatase 1
MGASRLFSRLLQPAPPSMAPLALPDDPLCVIGDVHGRLDLLDQLLIPLMQNPQAQRTRLVFVGDVVDRGPNPAGVLTRLWGLEATQRFASVTLLMGNHEQMMLDFLTDPSGRGARWMIHGGATTLASFGIQPSRSARSAGAAARLIGLRDAFLAALPQGTTEWLADRPLYWREDGLAVTHAGANPDRPLERQPEESLIWGHPDFGRRYRRDGLWIAHGHTIVPEPYCAAGRIAVDTGAYRTGRLSAAWIDARGVRFLSASDLQKGQTGNVARNSMHQPLPRQNLRA